MNTQKTSLLIMAAGLGSRYGGNKQVDRIGPDGEILMKYSVLYQNLYLVRIIDIFFPMK